MGGTILAMLAGALVLLAGVMVGWRMAIGLSPVGKPQMSGFAAFSQTKKTKVEPPPAVQEKF